MQRAQDHSRKVRTPRWLLRGSGIFVIRQLATRERIQAAAHQCRSMTITSSSCHRWPATCAPSRSRIETTKTMLRTLQRRLLPALHSPGENHGTADHAPKQRCKCAVLRCGLYSRSWLHNDSRLLFHHDTWHRFCLLARLWLCPAEYLLAYAASSRLVAPQAASARAVGHAHSACLPAR